MVKKAMAEAFAVVLEEFRDVTLKDSAVLESVGRQVHGVTGGQMREFAQRLRDAAPRPLTEEQILAWADAHHEREGRWPTEESGVVSETSGETWANISAALQRGFRGLPGGSSLAALLSDHRGVRNRGDLPGLTENQVLAWADSHYARTGKWPMQISGPVIDAPGETWGGIHQALLKGLRGLPGNSSLAKLLEEKRDRRNLQNLPSLTEEQVLSWADAHYQRANRWPNEQSGAVVDAPGETWFNVSQALRMGLRTLPGGTSLAKFLAEHRGARNHKNLPLLSEEKILNWADAHHSRTGDWPRDSTGPVFSVPGQSWKGVQVALVKGNRGLPGGSSLAKLLEEKRGVPNRSNQPMLTVEQILSWADAYRQRTGHWPTRNQGDIIDAPNETWGNVDNALLTGLRGLPGGSSLARLLQEKRDRRNNMNLPTLTVEQILAWADAFHGRMGGWPKSKSGRIDDAPDETWANVNNALIVGLRGLPGGSSLAKLLDECRSVRNRLSPPPLSVDQILIWADAHFRRTGQWPKQKTGPILDAPGETWLAIDHCLNRGTRGLPGGSSLARLIIERRDRPTS